MGMSEFYGTPDENEAIATIPGVGAGGYIPRYRRYVRGGSQRGY